MLETLGLALPTMGSGIRARVKRMPKVRGWETHVLALGHNSIRHRAQSIPTIAELIFPVSH